MTLHLICFAALTVPCTDGGRSTCCSVRKWPVVILQRMADLLGTELVQSRLKREITVFLSSQALIARSLLGSSCQQHANIFGISSLQCHLIFQFPGALLCDVWHNVLLPSMCSILFE